MERKIVDPLLLAEPLNLTGVIEFLSFPLKHKP
jgi:hypothetical protein